MWFSLNIGISAMNVTPAMIRPMAIVTIISSSVNPRFPLDFIVLSLVPQIKCQRCQHDADGATAAVNRTLTRSFIALSIFLGWGDDVKVPQVSAPGHAPFVICHRLLESLREAFLSCMPVPKRRACDFNLDNLVREEFQRGIRRTKSIGRFGKTVARGGSAGTGQKWPRSERKTYGRVFLR